MLILGATTAFGRIMFGRIVQIGILNRLHMHQLSMLVTGTMVMVLPIIKTYTGIVMYVLTVGLVDGCYVVLLPILTTSLVGIENSVLAWGFMIGTCSITFTLGPPVAGAIYDATGSYNIAFHCAGIPIVGGALLLFLIPWAQRTSGSGGILHILNEYTVQESNATTELTSSGSIGSTYDVTSAVQSTCSRHTNVTVRTTGTSPIQIEVADKSTSTDDNSVRYYSMDVEDALSHLSHNDMVFNDMLTQSRDTMASVRHPAATDSESSTQSIPRIPPPSEPVRYRQTDSSRQGSLQSHHSGTSSIRERPSSLSQASHPTSQRSIGSLQSSGATSSSVHSECLDAVLPTVSHLSALTDPLNVSQQIQYPQATSATSSRSSGSRSSTKSTKSLKKATSSSSASVARPETSPRDPTKDASNFDQTISDQVSILRETLRSPLQTDSKTCENIISSPAAEEFGARSMSLPRSIPSRPTSPESLHSHDASLYQQYPGISTEYSTSEEQQTSLAGSLSQDPNSVDRFATDNQITVIPGTNPFRDKNKTHTGEAAHPTKLEDLFKPAQEATAAATESSFELLDTPSEEAVRVTKSQTGELDVFKHLFTDEDT